jgi:hypothetical protein
MYKYIFFVSLIAASFLSSSNAFSKTCVLSLFSESSKEAQIVESVFGSYSEADLFKTAQIADIEKCFKSNEYDQITLAAHGSSINDGVSNYSTPILVKNDGSKILLPLRFFSKLSQITGYGSIKKVRISICGLDFTKTDTQMHSSIDPFIKKLEENNIEVDVSRRSLIGSILLRENVTILDRKWLAKSIDPDDSLRFSKWETEMNKRCEDDKWPGCDRSQAQIIIPLNTERTH